MAGTGRPTVMRTRAAAKSKTGECTLRCAQPELDSKPQSKASLKPVLTLAPVPLEVFVRVIARWRFLDELAAVTH